MSRLVPVGLVTAFVLFLFGMAPILSEYQLGVLSLVACYTIASLAQNLLAGYASVPSLGNVAFFAAAAYTGANLITLGHWPVLLALLAGVFCSGMLGMLVGLPSLRISGMHLAIVTVALVFVTRELMSQWDASHIEASSGISLVTPAWLLDSRGLYLAGLCLAVVAYVATWNLLRGRWGRALQAQSENPFAAAACGVSAMKLRLTAFVLSGVLTGIAGSIFMYYAHTVTPEAFPLDLSLAFLTMMILGGSRSLGGSVLGAVIIGLLPQVLRLLPGQIGSIDVQQSLSALYAVLLLVTLRYFPDGIWNVAHSVVFGRFAGADNPTAVDRLRD